MKYVFSMKSKIFFILFLSLCLTDKLYAQEYRIDTAIPYRIGSQDKYMLSKCKLDIYYPKGRSGFSTVVWFHGGGLTGGDRELPAELKNQGICVVGVSYRLCAGKEDVEAINPHVTTDDCVDDAAAAAAWVMKNIRRYGGDPDKIYLAGHSAGGYLVAMIGLDKRRLARYGVSADDFAAVIPFSGQMITHFQNRRDRGISDYRPLIDEAAPLYYVRKDSPPFLLICGDRERELLGRYEENAYMWRMLKLVGHTQIHLYELDGFDHGSMVRPGHYILLDYIRGRESRR